MTHDSTGRRIDVELRVTAEVDELSDRSSEARAAGRGGAPRRRDLDVLGANGDADGLSRRVVVPDGRNDSLVLSEADDAVAPDDLTECQLERVERSDEV